MRLKPDTDNDAFAPSEEEIEQALDMAAANIQRTDTRGFNSAIQALLDRVVDQGRVTTPERGPA